LGVAITLLLSHMFLESKTTSLIDSLEIASVKFLIRSPSGSMSRLRRRKPRHPPPGAHRGCRGTI